MSFLHPLGDQEARIVLYILFWSHMTEFTDLALMQQVQSGKEQAIVAIFDRHSKVVYSIAFRVLCDPTDAEDVLQETFLGLWRTPQDFFGSGSSLSQWLPLEARNKAVRSLQKSIRLHERLRAKGVNETSQVSSLLSPVSQPRGVCNSTSARTGGLLSLAFFEGKTVLEICQLTGAVPGTVKSELLAELSALKEDRALLEEATALEVNFQVGTPSLGATHCEIASTTHAVSSGDIQVAPQ